MSKVNDCMKWTQYIVLAIFTLAGLFACESKFPINGDLDGMWKVTSIERKNGTVEKPDQMFYSVQLKLINVRRSGSSYLGYFKFTGDSLMMDMKQGTDDQMLQFGMKGLKDTFAVETLNRTKMVLYNGESRIRFVVF